MIKDGPMHLHARLAELYGELADAHRKLAGEAGEQYVDQGSSPLGKRLHCRLVRSGALPGFRAGRRVLVRKADLDEYLSHHRVTPTSPPMDALDVLIAKMGGKVA